MGLKGAINRLLRGLERCPVAAVSTVCLLATVGIGFADFFSGLPLVVLYLFPILVAAWYTDGIVALTLAVIAAAAMFVAERAGRPDLSVSASLANALLQLALFALVISLLRLLRERLRSECFRARIDPLTGLLNEKALRERLERETERSLRYGHPFSLAYIDLDNFRAVNDAYGRGAGDIVLRRVAGTLRRCSRGSDTVARLGGDEFVVALPGAGSADAEAAIANLRNCLQTCLAELKCPVGLNIGLVSYERPPRDVREILRAAAAQRGKREGEQSSQTESLA